MASFTKKLVALDIRGCWRVTDRGMMLVAEYCPDLRVLNVTDCRDVTDRSLARLRARECKIDRPANPYALLPVPAYGVVPAVDRRQGGAGGAGGRGGGIAREKPRGVAPSLRLQV